MGGEQKKKRTSQVITECEDICNPYTYTLNKGYTLQKKTLNNKVDKMT